MAWEKNMKLLVSAILISLIPLSAPCASLRHEMSREVLAELNLARQHPSQYAKYLKGYRLSFRGKAYVLPGTDTLVDTREGVKAVDEAIRFLARQKPIPPLAWSDGLMEAAQELAADEGESGTVGHRGRSSGGPRERIERHGEWRGEIGENIYYGPGDARQVVISLIVDDGVPDRGHRKNIFKGKFGKAGVACGNHPGFQTICVIDFAQDFLGNQGN
jgi:uncharacterized protein YkwD